MEDNENYQNEENEDKESVEENIIPLEKKEEKKLTVIGNKTYDEDTLNRVTIIRLTQLGYSHAKIKDILGVKKSLVSKWMNHEKIVPKKMS